MWDCLGNPFYFNLVFFSANYYNKHSMSKKTYKKEKRETFGQKVVNFLLTICVACLLGNQFCTAASSNLRIAQVSDIHFSSYEENTSYKFLKKSPQLLDDVIFQLNTSGSYDFVVFTGDLVNKPKVSELEKVLSHIKKLNYPWFAINGNHDIAFEGQLTKDKFRKILADNNSKMKLDKNYYAFSPKKGYRVICLDSIIDYKLTSNGEISDIQLKWLKKELDSNKKNVVVICTHVPIDEPYNSSNHKLLNEYDVKSLLRSYTNPIIVLQGHYHCVRAVQDNNIIYITTPSLVTYPNAYRVININNNNKEVFVDVFLKETNLKDIQARSKMRLLGGDILYGEETDRNTTFKIKLCKENKD